MLLQYRFVLMFPLMFPLGNGNMYVIKKTKTRRESQISWEKTIPIEEYKEWPTSQKKKDSQAQSLKNHEI